MNLETSILKIMNTSMVETGQFLPLIGTGQSLGLRALKPLHFFLFWLTLNILDTNAIKNLHT